MSLISTKGVYGLAAMYELSKHNSQKPMQSKEIAKLANIPQNYLEQLLSFLKKAGLVESVRGAKGGYLLAKNAKTISIKEILFVLEGDLSVSNTPSTRVLNLFFDEYSKKMEHIFDAPLSKLDEYEEQLLKQVNYVI